MSSQKVMTERPRFPIVWIPVLIALSAFAFLSIRFGPPPYLQEVSVVVLLLTAGGPKKTIVQRLGRCILFSVLGNIPLLATHFISRKEAIWAANFLLFALAMRELTLYIVESNFTRSPQKISTQTTPEK